MVKIFKQITRSLSRTLVFPGSILLLVMFLRVGAAVPVSAAKTPGPTEKAYSNQLNEILNHLEAVHQQLSLISTKPPNPNVLRNSNLLNPIVGQLNAITNQLEEISRHISKSGESFGAIDHNLLQEVCDEAYSLWAGCSDRLSVPAIQKVSEAAWGIVTLCVVMGAEVVNPQ